MKLKSLLFTLGLTAITSTAQALTLTSSDIGEGQTLANTYVFKGFGCEGENISPTLTWSNAPKGTKSFAITVYDPDAPTGSGWWHWQLINIPASVNQLAQDAGNTSQFKAPEGSRHIKNDYGTLGFGGACPPPGDDAHRYRFTVHALGIEKIELPEDPSSALTGYFINANTLASSTIEAKYQR